MPGGCDQNRAEGEAASGPGSGEQIQLLAQEEFQTALLGAQLETAIEGILVVDADQRVILFNHRFAEMWCLPDRVLEPRDDHLLLEYVSGQIEDFAAFRHSVEHLYRSPAEKSRYEIRLKDGRVFERYSAPLIDTSQRHYGRIFYFRDITEGQRASDQLRHSEHKYRRLYESMRDAFVQLDMDGTVQESNPVFRCLLGYSAEELAKLTARQLTPERWRALEAAVLKDQVLARGYSDVYEKEYRKKDGSVFPVELRMVLIRDETGRPAGMWAIVRDISERKKREWDLRQAQRLESAGQLAAGIAHEINTPIQYIGDNLRFIADSFHNQHAVIQVCERVCQASIAGRIPASLGLELRQAIEDSDWEYASQEMPAAVAESLEGVSRVATIVRAMKDFAHPGRQDLAAADLNRALTTTVIVARNELNYVATVETDFGPLPPVVCYIAEINQVFLNLLFNAAHAIEDVMKRTHQKGTIRIRTRQSEDQVLISIADTGCGIPEHIRPRIFDPFFTTKEVGRGTGQGLAIARSIVVEKHGGSLRFEPNEPQGTIFTISLPLEPALKEGSLSADLSSSIGNRRAAPAGR